MLTALFQGLHSILCQRPNGGAPNGRPPDGGPQTAAPRRRRPNGGAQTSCSAATLRQMSDPSYELTQTSPIAFSPQFLHSKLKTLPLANPILIHRSCSPYLRPSPPTPSTIHHSRLTVCLPA